MQAILNTLSVCFSSIFFLLMGCSPMKKTNDLKFELYGILIVCEKLIVRWNKKKNDEFH